MQLKSITLNNFGIYGGTQTFDLEPTSQDQFERPIILFSGKNGVGKTTLAEAIKICLYGRVALSNSTSRREYEDHIFQKIHHSPGNGKSSKSAFVKLVFKHVSSGNQIEYVVTRNWSVSKSNIKEQLEICEDGKHPSWLQEEMKEHFIRELIPPHFSSMFFLDGEKIDQLVYQFSIQHSLPSIFHDFLGLSLVSQLQQDLDVFISKQLSKNGEKENDQRLQIATKNLRKSKDRVNKLLLELQKITADIQAVTENLTLLEQKFASDGGHFAENFERVSKRKADLEQFLEIKHRLIQELSNNLAPFSVSPDMLILVRERLLLEEQFKKQNITKDLLSKQDIELAKLFRNKEFWESLGIEANKNTQEAILKKIMQSIKRPAPNKTINEDDVILLVSEREREILISWIDEALSHTPATFSEAITEYTEIAEEIETIKVELKKVPPNEKIQIVHQDFLATHQKLDALKENQQSITLELEEIERRQEFHEAEVRWAREEIGESEKSSDQVHMASKAQTLLDEYSVQVLDQKLRLIENAFVTRFNSLCRKDTFIEDIKIDRKTFSITLERDNRQFFQTELSAGETHLFVISLIWALHDVSQLPMPIIFDTPLARLDKDHRQAMLIEFFPKVSHQLILLATDAEIDRKMITELSPVTSHGYRLSFDPSLGNAQVDAFTPEMVSG